MGTTLWTFKTTMAQNFWLSLIAWIACFLMTILVSLMTAPKPVSELKSLVWGVTDVKLEEHDRAWWEKPAILAVIVAVLCIALNIYFR